MEVVVITSSGKSDAEIVRIIELFEQGLQTLHVRKPKFSSSDVEEFLVSIPDVYHGRIVIHGHYHLAIKYKLKGIHLQRSHRIPLLKNRWKRFLLTLRRPGLQVSTTFRSLQSLSENKWKFNYVFLGPIFTSHSHYHMDDIATVNSLRIQISRSPHKVYATGGVDEDKLELIRTAGFRGVGLSSIVWKKVNDWKDLPGIIHRFEAA